jgi:lysophospholipase L1-like esterase
MTVPQLKKNKTIAFSGTFTGTLSEISVVQGEGTGWTEVKCVVTATSITILKDNSSVYTAEHGLTFGTHFSLVLATKNQNKTKAYLESGGKPFTTGEFVWNTSRNSLKLYTNVPFTQYRFSFGSNDFDKKIWMYGDSYFDHWLPLSIVRGYTNCLADGYSGGGSSAGLSSFRLALEHGTPSKVVWCLGMNDGDSAAVSTSWLNAVTEVKRLCDENGIELWVTTIPNTPSVNNAHKNAYIRSNFANYIDLSKYVGAEESTTWYSGLLSSDNVHPTTEGDFYIANIMETYFPEMLDV